MPTAGCTDELLNDFSERSDSLDCMTIASCVTLMSDERSVKRNGPRDFASVLCCVDGDQKVGGVGRSHRRGRGPAPAHCNQAGLPRMSGQ